ncbi:MAG: hypothetical protein KDD15_27305 [Lewinella sp.]|nr:hypothetical protein [Lewinella sp.]
MPDTLPPEKALHQSIDSCYAQRAYLELLEFKNTRKGEWLKFLPNIGISYTLNGQPRPAVSFSSGLLYQARKARLQRLAKQEQIVQSTLSEAEEAKAELATLLLRHSILQEEIVAQHKRHQIEQEIFLIQEDEYNRLERSPAEYLQAKRTFLIQQETLEDLKRRSLLLEMEILQHACFPADTTHFSGAFQK